MPAYWIGYARMKDPEGYRRYAQLAQPAMAAHQPKVLVRTGTAEMLEGSAIYDRFVVLEFPTRQAALDCYWSPAYQQAARIRQEASAECRLLIVDGI